MSKYQSVVTGAPIATTQFAQPAPRTPSIGQQLIGGLGTIAGAYGAFGGKLPTWAKKHGGGLSDIVYRNKGDFGSYPKRGDWEGMSPYLHPDVGSYEWDPRYNAGFSMRNI